MEISIDSLVPFEKILNAANDVFELVDKSGKIVLLRNNQPAYIITKYSEAGQVNLQQEKIQNNLTLQEAMKIVLEEAENQTLHASELADIIYDRKLYYQKNG